MRTCSDEAEGPEICNTYYETACETTYKTYEVEQDEPVCRMEIMTKCEDVKCKCIFLENLEKKKNQVNRCQFFSGKKRTIRPCYILRKKTKLFLWIAI